MKKRLLSLVLALAMMVSLLPAVSLVQAAPAEQEFITVEKRDYGQRWRAWSGQPTEEERNETRWK